MNSAENDRLRRHFLHRTPRIQDSRKTSVNRVNQSRGFIAPTGFRKINNEAVVANYPNSAATENRAFLGNDGESCQ
jgi:hypothetical protein